MQVLNKKSNLNLFSTNAFGAKSPSWNTLQEVRESNYKEKVVLRTTMGGNGLCCYDLTIEEAENVVKNCGIDPSFIYFNATTDDNFLVLQGEYMESIIVKDSKVYACCFTYTTIKKKMRIALKEESHVEYGIQARKLLIEAMTPSSWSDFEAVLENFPNHIVEVSVYNNNYGDILGRNAIVWEVRTY